MKTSDIIISCDCDNYAGERCRDECGRVKYYRTVAGPRPTVNSLLKPRRRRVRFVRNGPLSVSCGTCIRMLVRACACVRMRGEARERASSERTVRNERTAALAARVLTLPTTTTMLYTSELVRGGASPRTQQRFVLWRRQRSRCACVRLCVRATVRVCVYVRMVRTAYTPALKRDARPPTGAEPDRW